MDLDDADLRAGLAAGTPDWAAIYARFRTPMWRSAARVLGRDQSTLGNSADSVVHDTMEALIKKTQQTLESAIPPDVDSIEAFLRRATRNRALNVVRRAKQKEMVPLPELDDSDVLGREDDLEEVEDGMILDQLDSQLDLLSETERAAYNGYFKQRRTQADIAAQLGVSDRWVAKLCTSAIRKLTIAAGIEPHDTGR
jgi:RNA polymerase sigma factor (sigma-70 family)